MAITYPPELLPSPDEGEEAEVVVLDEETLMLSDAFVAWFAEAAHVRSVSLDELKIELGLETIH